MSALQLQEDVCQHDNGGFPGGMLSFLRTSGCAHGWLQTAGEFAKAHLEDASGLAEVGSGVA